MRYRRGFTCPPARLRRAPGVDRAQVTDTRLAPRIGRIRSSAGTFRCQCRAARGPLFLQDMFFRRQDYVAVDELSERRRVLARTAVAVRVKPGPDVASRYRFLSHPGIITVPRRDPLTTMRQSHHISAA